MRVNQNSPETMKEIGFMHLPLSEIHCFQKNIKLCILSNSKLPGQTSAVCNKVEHYLVNSLSNPNPFLLEYTFRFPLDYMFPDCNP